MKCKSTRIYIKSSPERNETLFSGIEFIDFMECVPPIANILLLKGNFWAEKSWRKFELVEGKNQIDKLMQENVRNYGDFCFVDYADIASINQVSDEQIAGLLYISHMFKPLKSPFFEVLQNKYAYLAHDDGWYCKLYCKDRQIPISIVMHKLQKQIENIEKAFGDNALLLPENLGEVICKLSTSGLLIEFDISTRKSGISRKSKVAETVILKLYEVGEYEDMDALFNNLEQIKPQASFGVQLLK